jgi:hypothetical protein
MANLIQAQLDIKVWNGRFTSDIPSDPTYTIVKQPIGTENNVQFEISELFKDYIEPTFTNDYNTISTAVWVHWTITKTFSDASPSTQTGFGLGVQGYGYFSDGANPSLGTGKQIDNSHIYVPEGESMTIPIFLGTDGVNNVKLYKDGSLISNVNYNIIDTLSEEYPDDLIYYVRNSDDIDYATLTKDDSTTETIYVNPVCEPKFEPYKVAFLNKYGVIQDLWFFKKRTDSIDVTKDQYNRSTVTVDSNLTATYSTNKAANSIIDLKSTRSLKLNTGFVKEEYTETIQQLMLSENVWIVEDNTAYPVIPSNQNLNYKTVLNDKLINFTVDFKYAFNESNIIR